MYCWLLCLKPKCMSIFLYLQNLKSCGLESHTDRVRIYRYQRVADVNQSHKPTLQAIAAHENSSGLQNPPYLAQQNVLPLRRGHMMQHGERNCSRKLAIRKWHRRSVARNYLDVATAQAPTQGLRQLWVDLDRGDAPNRRPQHIGRETGARSDLKHVRPQVCASKSPRHPLLNGFAPESRPA